MNKLLPKVTLNKVLAALCVLLLFVYIVPHVFLHARANGSITVSNVAFDPATGTISFDYTSSDNLTGNTGNLQIYDTTVTTVYWDNGSLGACTSSHCHSTLTPITTDSGVSSVKLHVQVGSTVDDSQTLNYPLPLPTTNTPQTPTVGGWTNIGETWTYASADSPTFTATVTGDLTGVYAPGMRVKLTQSSTTKYFIITAASYSNPNTTLTLYGGTDYTLANSAISNVYFSMQKAPLGFPLDPAKWTVETRNTSDNSQSSPTQGTWYNIGSVSIAIPIGAWRVTYQIAVQLTNTTAGTFASQTTLSTGNNSESDTDFSTYQGTYVNLNNGYVVMREKNLNLSSKTTYYLNTKSNNANLGTIYNLGSESPTFIRAVSSYL